MCSRANPSQALKATLEGEVRTLLSTWQFLAEQGGAPAAFPLSSATYIYALPTAKPPHLPPRDASLPPPPGSQTPNRAFPTLLGTSDPTGQPCSLAPMTTSPPVPSVPPLPTSTVSIILQSHWLPRPQILSPPPQPISLAALSCAFSTPCTSDSSPSTAHLQPAL